MSKGANELSKLKKVISDLEQKNAELEAFVSHATHDLKEPIRSFAIGAEILLKKHKDKLDSEGIQMLEFMLNSSKRFENIVAALKNYTKADSGKLQIDSVSLNLIIQNAIYELQPLMNLKQAKISADKLPNIETDADKLQLVFKHLIDNALKYHGSESPIIHIGYKNLPGNRISLFVKDEGIGIAAEQQERIMKPFERLHSKFEIEGMGLGIPLCKKILQRLDGTLSIHSEKGKGTTLNIILPVNLTPE